MTLNKREKLLLKIALIIIISLSIIFWVIIPLWSDYQKVSKDIEKNKLLLKQNKLILEAGKKYKNKLLKVNKELGQTKILFFSNDVSDTRFNMIKIIDDYLKESKLDIINKDIFIEQNNENNIAKIVYSLNLKGNYENIISFLKNINSYPKLLIVDKL